MNSVGHRRIQSYVSKVTGCSSYSHQVLGDCQDEAALQGFPLTFYSTLTEARHVSKTLFRYLLFYFILPGSIELCICSSVSVFGIFVDESAGFVFSVLLFKLYLLYVPLQLNFCLLVKICILFFDLSPMGMTSKNFTRLVSSTCVVRKTELRPAKPKNNHA